MRLLLKTKLEVAVTLARAGMLRPVRPDRLLSSGLALWRWGTTLATAYVVHGTGKPGSVAIADNEGELTYGQVHERTNALARGLGELGVREADRVAILCRNGRGFVEVVAACAKLGADLLLLNTSFGPSELEAVMGRDHPRALVYDDEFEQLVARSELDDSILQVVVPSPQGGPSPLPSVEELIAAGDRTDLRPPEHESKPIVLTSGTTGPPKGARVATPASMDPLAWFLRRVPLKVGMPTVIQAPLFHAHGFGQLSIGSGLGCKLVLARRFDAEQTLELIERHRAEGLVVVPVMLKRILDLPPETRGRYDCSSLRVVLASGSALHADAAHAFMDEFGPVLYNLYGSTEVSWATIATPDDLREAPGTVGRPPPHTRVAILDDQGKELPAGETGRIFVGHELLFEGYTDGSAGAARAQGMLTPGDLGHMDSEGRLFVDSRADDMIISGGENVYPGEVEAALGEHPGVGEIALVGVDDEQFGQRLAAFVVPKQGSDLTETELLAYAKEKLARYKVPREVHMREALPRNALGKVLKRELR